MNNNRNNNRRRGRSNRGQGGGSQGNRIDSRARGNAPQLLEKYKKLAHDASLNGDRVQTEYYLQFADHYFRVIADNKAQKDEHRGRRDEREQDDDAEDETEFEDSSGRRDRNRGRRDDRERGDDEQGRRANEGEEASQDEDDNPFTRDSRPRRENRGRKERGNGGDAESPGLDPDSLPPAIGAQSESADESEGEAPRPRRRTRKPRTPEGGDEKLEAVG